MTRIGRVPPGRSGRLWLRRRLELAHRGVDLLERKRRVLQAERDRLGREAARTADVWAHASRDADRWLDRVVLLGGERAISAAAPPARVTIDWTRSMGVAYPAHTDCTCPDPDDVPLDGPAVTEARDHHRRALAAAVAHAAALTAVRLVDTELRATTRRMRAISDRWIPALARELARLDIELEEQEHADLVRRRWLVGRSVTGEGRR